MSKAGLGYVIAGTTVGGLTGLVAGIFTWPPDLFDLGGPLPLPAAAPGAGVCGLITNGVPETCSPGFVCAEGLIGGTCVTPATLATWQAQNAAAKSAIWHKILATTLLGGAVAYLAVARPWES